MSTNNTNAPAAGQAHQLNPINHKVWPGYCKFATKLNRGNELTDFLVALQAGQCNNVTDPTLFVAAAALAVAAADAGLRLTNWGSPPSAEELASPTWLAERVAAERANQETAERRKRWEQGLARAQGQPRPAGTGGTISPTHLQKSKLSFDELVRRLRWVMEQHQAKHGEFKRQWLDHNSSHFIHGGIGTKGVIFMANEIVGRRERRSPDENWAIVTNWLREQHAKQEAAQ